MASIKDCWRKCLRGTSGIPWWAVAAVIIVAGALIIASGGQFVVFGIVLAATLKGLGITLGAGVLMTLAICMLSCR